MKRGKKVKTVQTEFPFIGEPRPVFRTTAPNLPDLGRLPVSVLKLGARARKWLKAHRIGTLGELAEAEKNKVVSGKCLDQQVRKDIQAELERYWGGKKFKYLIALNFLDRGVDRVLADKKLCSLPLSRLALSPPLLHALEGKQVGDIGTLLLQPELNWRNPRVFGNILVEEVLLALSKFLEEVSRG